MKEEQITEGAKQLQKLVEQLRKDYYLIPRSYQGGIIAGAVVFLVMTGVISWQTATKAIETTAAVAAIHEISRLRNEAESDAKRIADIKARLPEGPIQGYLNFKHADGSSWTSKPEESQTIHQDLPLDIPPNTFRGPYHVFAAVSAFDFNAGIHNQLDVDVITENKVPVIRLSHPVNTGFATAKVIWLAYPMQTMDH